MRVDALREPGQLGGGKQRVEDVGRAAERGVREAFVAVAIGGVRGEHREGQRQRHDGQRQVDEEDPPPRQVLGEQPTDHGAERGGGAADGAEDAVGEAAVAAGVRTSSPLSSQSL